MFEPSAALLAERKKNVALKLSAPAPEEGCPAATERPGENGQPLVNPFLWALETRTGGTGSDLNAVYFTAGINNQNDGLFGKIDPVPEPATLLETVSGLIALALLRRRCT